ncbi:MAG: hypothetical protein GX806_04010, partial [Lentisphaerae bacterium]|nr:hypothetical protein [Lentisphaerota bacterium]
MPDTYIGLENGPRRRRARGAFTLLEVLLALGIVSMLVLMVTNMFQQVSFSWHIGTQSAERSAAGRAAMDFMVRELSQAVAGPVVGSSAAKLRFWGASNQCRCVTLAGDPVKANARALRGAIFQWDSDSLWYCRTNAAYVDPHSWTWFNEELLAANIIDFKFTFYPTPADLINQASVVSYDSLANGDRLPLCMDIYLQVLGDEDARRLKDLPAERSRHARIYT